MLFFLRVSGSIGTRIYRELHGNFLDDKRTKQKMNKTKTLKKTGVDSEAGIDGKCPTFFFFFPFRGRRRSAPLLYLPLSPQPSKPVQILAFPTFRVGSPT